MKIIYLFLLSVTLSSPASILAQTKVINGFVKDGHSDEPLPFASVTFKNTSIGKATDSSGTFQFEFSSWPSDTLEISSISYETYYFKIPQHSDTINLVAALQAGKANAEAIVKAKHSRGWYLWRKIVAHKDSNNIFKNENFTYTIYNKLEVDLNNVNIRRLEKNKLFHPFNFILNNVDTTTEEKPIIPAFFSETMSQFYFQKKPHRTRELILANKISGIKNESVTKYLGGLYQNIVVYDNFIPVFDKKFISPLNNEGDAYYDYRLADTQRIAERKFFHLVFIPKRSGQNTFTGDCWVHDSTFAIQKIILHINKEANINYVDKLSLVQEFKLIDDSTWFLSKDKFVVNFNPVGNKGVGFIARKTTNYGNVSVNASATGEILKKNKVIEEVEVSPAAKSQSQLKWDSVRTEPLSRNEEGIYKMVDSLQHSPAYKKYYSTLYFITTGYKNIGKFQIGPWFSWISADSLEGTRVRFDLGTNKHFSNHIYLHGYLAYGFSDKKFKVKAEALWLINRNPWQSLSASYSNDLDFSQNYNNEIASDNFLAVAIRKHGIPHKFIMLDKKELRYFRDTKIGLSATITLANKKFNPLIGIPSKLYFPGFENDPFNSTEVSVKFRFAYTEKFYSTNFFRYSLGSPFPIAEIEYTKGIKNFLNSNFDYQKISGSINDQVSIAPLGTLNYNIYGGKIFGTLPYVFLEVHPGNEVYYYNRYAFNLMNRYEYISDSYAGFSIEHNVGNGLFRFIPLTRKLKFRQFWNLKGITGSLSTSNKVLNYVGNFSFQSLDGKLYLEGGTGIDNIFELFRLDFVWRFLPTPLPTNNVSRFGIFGSFKLQL